MAFTGLSLAGNGFIWVNEFRGILERFSGYVLNGLSVYGCIVPCSCALWAGFRCFLGGSILNKEKCSYLWHGFIYYVYKKKSLKNFLVECLDIRKLFLPLLPKTIRNDNKTNINY